MAIMQALSMIGSALVEAASVMEMELMLFVMAGLIYVAYTGGLPGLGVGGNSKGKAKGGALGAGSSFCGSNVDRELREHASKGDNEAVLRVWERVVRMNEAPDVDLAIVADALCKSGRTVSEVVAEFRRATTLSPGLLRSLGALPSSLLRDDAVELLSGVLPLLSECGQSVETSVYVGLMSAQLRRRDHVGIADTAAKLPAESLTPRMRAMLAVAAAHRGRLDEALGHLRQMPDAVPGGRSPMPAGYISQIMSVALREQRAGTAREELRRVGVEAQQFEEALHRDGRRREGRKREGEDSVSGGIEVQRHVAMIKACARQKDLPGARKIFERLQAGGTSLCPQIYNSFLDACVQSGDAEAASVHFSEMKRLGYADVVGCNTILKAYLAQGLAKEARELVQDMIQRGLQPNKVTYNELLHAKVISRDRQGIWNIIDEMREAGIRPNSVTCSILLKSLTPQSSPWDTKRVMNLIDEVDESTDEVLFCSVVEACIRLQQLDLLSELMTRYRQRGIFVKLSAPTYGSMIKAYGQAGQPDRVKELWEEMEENGVEPTVITIGCMIEALVINSLAEEALELIHRQLEIEERKSFINTVVYSTVLKGFAVKRRVDRVFAVYAEMRSKGIPCNTITYNTMLDACAKGCSMSRASTLLEDMKDTQVEPDIITYSTIIKGYCSEGDVDRAFSILTEMKRDGKFSPDEIMYNSILDGCAKQHRVEEAMRLLDEMKSTGIGPSNYTLSILVKLLGHARRLNQAFRMVKDLSEQSGFRPNIQVYTCLVQACALNRDLNRAFQVHDAVAADESCRVDEKFYGVLARSCLQTHQPFRALEVVRAAYRLPCKELAPLARRRGPPAGVEARILDEVAAHFQGGGREEHQAWELLTAELQEQCGVQVGVSSGHPASRVGGGRQAEEAGRQAPRRRAPGSGGRGAGR